MKNLYKIQDELYIIDNNEKVTQNGIWAKCSFTEDILKNRNGQYAHKVILTTNKLLIKDGVQALDDEFLNWFVKNPSCEFVEIQKFYGFAEEYLIIIPKEETYVEKGLDYMIDLEEPKQETLEEAELNEKEFYKYMAKQDSWKSTGLIIQEFIQLKLKEQQERSYSEEEAGELVYNIIGELAKHYDIMIDGAKLNELFEQFKKK